jgi:uncharacterized repeat protein (TIGR03803 family)
MKLRRFFLAVLYCAVLVCAVLLFAGAAMAAGPTETVLHNFTGAADGGYPMAGLILDQTGALYGTAIIGGNFSACDEGGACGTIFELVPPSQGGGAWTESELYDFQYQDPYPPSTNLVFDQAGNLYGGTGPNQGSATFQLTESAGIWSLNPIYYPGAGAPVFDTKGNLYVLGGGADGSIVELTPQPGGTWNSTTLYTFTGGNDGKLPESGVIVDHAGNLYGTTLLGGGSTQCGVVYELSPQTNGSWTESILHSFTGTASDGCYPQAEVIVDHKGNLYGTTQDGGLGPCTSGCGVVFELSPPAQEGGAWTETVLHKFNNTNGANPYAGLAIDSTGALYGTTAAGGNGPCEPKGAGCGTVFRLTPPSKPGGAWSEIFYSFQGPDGENPFANVILDESKGVLYGTTRNGGTYDYGTVFQIAR